MSKLDNGQEAGLPSAAEEMTICNLSSSPSMSGKAEMLDPM
jgi:hypothetical protein